MSTSCSKLYRRRRMRSGALSKRRNNNFRNDELAK